MRDLYWGDNLKILRDHIPDESVDLIPLDPPFNSNRNYNVLFKETSRVESDAQIEAFTDTWKWTESAEATYDELVHGNQVPQKVTDLIIAMRSFIGANDIMAYLVMMTIRLIELHRVLKPTGSIYLHCDSTASHYLKVVMDTIWGPKNFRNEIIWKRRYGTFSTVHTSNKFGASTDTILFYAKSDDAPFHPQYSFSDPSYQQYIEKAFRFVDANGRRYRIDNLANPAPRPNLIYEYKGYKPPTNGWAISREKMEQWDQEGRLHFPKDPNGRIQRIRYLDEVKGKPVQNLWDDIDMISSQSAERLGYPTQKPEALLERIINASSNPGDVVMDPFCGCGTAIAVAEKLDRQWIGIDITHLAIALIVSRMESAFPGIEITRHGEPADVGGARALAQLDRYDFQDWALAFVRARPIAHDERGKSKKGADKGIDGVIMFLGDDEKKPHRCLVQVKSGHVNSGDISQLRGTIERENAQIGLFITLEEPTGPMQREAVEAGFYRSNLMQRDYPRIQILTIRELFDRREPQMPSMFNPYRLAERRNRDNQQRKLFDTGTG
jgi:site-specific DNA-methyltransferase (adenine-specific)